MYKDLHECRLEGGAQGFRYLRESQSEAAPCFTLDDVDDGEGLRSTLDAMQIVGISGSADLFDTEPRDK